MSDNSEQVGVSLTRRDFTLAGLALCLVSENTEAAKKSARRRPKPDIESFTGIDATTGEVIFELNGEEIIRPASQAKMMTLLLGFEAMKDGLIDAKDRFSIPPEILSRSVKERFSGWRGKIGYAEYLSGAAIKSYNDLASSIGIFVAKARGYGDSEADFVRLMNEKAHEIGMYDTNFYNASGLPQAVLKLENEGSTTRDLAILLKHISDHHPDLHALLGTEKIRDPQKRWMINTNDLLQKEYRFDIGDEADKAGFLSGFFKVIAGKTGYTRRAGSCLTAEVTLDDGRRIIASYVGGEGREHRKQRFTHFVEQTIKEWDKKKPALDIDSKGEKVEVGQPDYLYHYHVDPESLPDFP